MFPVSRMKAILPKSNQYLIGQNIKMQKMTNSKCLLELGREPFENLVKSTQSATYCTVT